MKATELSWVAGLFEGEGSVSVTKTGRSQLAVYQKNPEILNRLQEAVQMGKVYGPYTRATRVTKTPSYHCSFRVNGLLNIQRFLDLIWSYLTPITQDKVTSKLNEAIR